ncbi:unnamed protein product, partial [Nesidiocoris tenuis]
MIYFQEPQRTYVFKLNVSHETARASLGDGRLKLMLNLSLLVRFPRIPAGHYFSLQTTGGFTFLGVGHLMILWFCSGTNPGFYLSPLNN